MRIALLLSMLALAVLPLQAQPNTHAPAAPPPSYLLVGQILPSTRALVSDNLSYALILGSEANLCVFPRGGTGPSQPPIWCSNATAQGPAFFATMQSDGNACVYPGTGLPPTAPAVWCSNVTASGGKFFLKMNGDGNLIVYSGDVQAPTGVVWQSGVVYAQVDLDQPPANTTIAWPDGQTCPPACTRNYRVGTSLTLTSSTTQTGFLFKEWTGGRCAGSDVADTCQIQVPAFSPATPKIGVRLVSGQKLAFQIPPGTGNSALWCGNAFSGVPDKRVTIELQNWNQQYGLFVIDDGLIRLASNPAYCLTIWDVDTIMKPCDRNDALQTTWFYGSNQMIRKTNDPTHCLAANFAGSRAVWIGGGNCVPYSDTVWREVPFP